MEVTWQHPAIIDYNGDIQTPPPFGRSRFHFNEDVRVIKDGHPASISDLKPGDFLRVNTTAASPGELPQAAEMVILPVFE